MTGFAIIAVLLFGLAAFIGATFSGGVASVIFTLVVVMILLKIGIEVERCAELLTKIRDRIPEFVEEPAQQEPPARKLEPPRPLTVGEKQEREAILAYMDRVKTR